MPSHAEEQHMWDEEHKQAIKCLMDGDEDAACGHWQNCVKIAEESGVPPSFQLAEAYQYFGCRFREVPEA